MTAYQYHLLLLWFVLSNLLIVAQLVSLLVLRARQQRRGRWWARYYQFRYVFLPGLQSTLCCRACWQSGPLFFLACWVASTCERHAALGFSSNTWQDREPEARANIARDVCSLEPLPREVVCA